MFNLVDKSSDLLNQGRDGRRERDAAVEAKEKAEAVRVYCKLLIDGVQVAETRRLPLKWPSYEVDLSDQFQIHVFTLPSKVQLEIMIRDKLADRLDLVIPGGHVRALTSASRLIKEYEFSQRQQYIETRLGMDDDVLIKGRPPAGEDAGAEGDRRRAEAAAYDAEQEKLKAMELEGTILVRAEWQGRGEQMPPARSETLFQANA